MAPQFESLGDVLHHLVENSQAFDSKSKVQAHKVISAQLEEAERHHSVPSPEAEQASADEKAQKIAELKAQLAELGDDDEEPSELWRKAPG